MAFGGRPPGVLTIWVVVSFSGHDLLRVEAGRFAEYWVISETEHLLAQLNPS
ncbi:MAG TPA: hypothetical protein VIJ13_10010 [Actinomycetota bacterium]